MACIWDCRPTSANPNPFGIDVGDLQIVAKRSVRQYDPHRHHEGLFHSA